MIIRATPLPVFDRAVPDNRFGPLTYLGGLSLSSSHSDFEALSGLDMAGDRMLMVTDEGHWVTATLEANETGVPLGLANAMIGPLLGGDGNPLGGKATGDAEGLALIGDAVWVTAERNQPIRTYALENGSLEGAATLPLGAETPLQGRRNAGIEAIVHMERGPLRGETLIFLEKPPRSASAATAMRLLPNGQRVPFAVQRRDDFAITGAAALPDGDVLLLERRFSWDDGIFMRLRLLRASEIASGAVQGRRLLHADGGSVIDNMEGVATTEHPDGPIITLVSDDNGNFFQRTVLLRFQINGSLDQLTASTPPAPVARPASLR